MRTGLIVGLLIIGAVASFGYCMYLLCKPTPEFYINGIAYYTQKHCLESKVERKYEFHYGYSYRGKFEYFYGPHTVSTCIKYKIDTLKIQTP